MAALSEQELGQLEQPPAISSPADIPVADMAVPDLEDSIDMGPPNSATEGLMSSDVQLGASAASADDHQMDLMQHTAPVEDASDDIPIHASPGVQLPPQQLHSRLSQVPAYAQLPQVSFTLLEASASHIHLPSVWCCHPNDGLDRPGLASCRMVSQLCSSFCCRQRSPGLLCGTSAACQSLLLMDQSLGTASSRNHLRLLQLWPAR